MCGLILIVGPPPDGIEQVCEQVGRRGPHSHGWAIYDGSWRTERAPGPLTVPPPGDWAMALGHSRLATSGAHAGDLPDPEAGQPLDLGTLIVAHNGTLKQHRNGNESDTALALREARTFADIPTALTSPDNAPQAAIAVNKATLEVLAYRTGTRGGHPLFHKPNPHGWTLSSIPTHGSTLTPTGITLKAYTQP